MLRRGMPGVGTAMGIFEAGGAWPAGAIAL